MNEQELTKYTLYTCVRFPMHASYKGDEGESHIFHNGKKKGKSKNYTFIS